MRTPRWLAIRRSGLGCRETSGPPEIPHGALFSVGRPRRESGESDPGTHEVRVHAVRLGGRSRSDASRVFFSWRSQDLLENEGASQEEVRSSTDAGRGWAEGKPVRVREVANKFPRVRPAGSSLASLAGSRYDGRRSRAFARLAFTGRTKQGPLTRRSTPPRQRVARPRADAGQRIGRTRIPTRACLRVTTGTSEIDTVR
jgi:hypothetical protein